MGIVDELHLLALGQRLPFQNVNVETVPSTDRCYSLPPSSSEEAKIQAVPRPPIR
jgi:hypothetical protein